MATTNPLLNTATTVPPGPVAAPVPAPVPAPAPVLTNQKPYRPGLKEWQDKSGLDFNTAASLYNGVIGSNKDTRDWNAIMSAADPVAAARKATYDMYGGVTVKDIDYGGRIIPKLVAADGTILTNPGKRDINFGIGSLPVTAGQATPTPAAPTYEQMVLDAYRSIGRTGLGTEVSNIDQAGFDYWLNALKSGQSTPEAFQRNFQNAISDYLTKNPQDQYSTYVTNYLEGEKTRKADAADLNKQFGVAGDVTKPTSEGILSGFKYAKDAGLSEDQLRKTLGDDVFNTYKTGFANYAKTGIANILADDKLSFDEAREAVKFGRDYGYDSQKLADLTGQKKELFDTINKSYDETADKIIDSVLGAENVKTDTDRIVESLKLQNKYGFTDEDLAKATGYDATRLKSDLDPVRNYGSAYKETLAKPDVTGKDIIDFLEKSQENAGIGAVYGPNISGQIAKIKELDQKWGQYGVDGYQAENISNQLGKITDAAGGKNWSGEWMGGGDNAKLQATALLMKKGVDNLADLGVDKNYKKTPASKEFYNGQVVRTDEDGKKFILAPDAEGNLSSYAYLPKDAKTVPGTSEASMSGDGDWSETSRPLTEEELKTYDPKTGEYEQERGTKLIDKSTGKVIATNEGGSGSFGGMGGGDPNRFTLDSYQTGNFFKGKNKEFGIMMTDKGVPIPYQTTERDGFVYSPAFPIMASFLMPGIGNAISGMLPGAGAAATATSAAISPTLLNTALTQGIMGGGMAALTGGDILKGAVLGGIGAPISAGISSLLPTGLDPNIARAVTGAGTGVVKGVLQGGDFEDLLGQGVLSGLANYGLGETTKGLNLTPQQLNLATGIALPLLQGKDINPINLIGTAANYLSPQK